MTLRLDCAAICGPDRPHIVVRTPAGQPLEPAAYKLDTRRYRHLVTVPAMDGTYHVRACASG